MKYISYNVEHMNNDYNKLLYNIFSLKIVMILKNKFKDQTRPDQTRPDQTRPDQTRPDLITICKEYILVYNNSESKKIQPMLHSKNVA